MKRTDSTEMDRLLRRHALRGGETLRAKDDATTTMSSGTHLDADEMNAYAEGALPEAARSRYFAHLADCDSCRKLVTELTLAASRADEGKARIASLEPATPNSWRERWAVIFSPPVLRYGVPALALFAVIIVAIVAMRTNRPESGVALNAEQSRYAQPTSTIDSNPGADATTTTGTTANHANSNVSPLDEAQNRQPYPDAAASPLPPANSSQMEDGAPVLSQSTIPKPGAAQTDDNKDTSGEFGVVAKREQPQVAAAPAQPPPAPKATDMAASTGSEVVNRDKREEQKKNKVGGREDTDEISVSGRPAGGVVASQRVANEAQPEVGKTTTARAARSEARERPSTAPKSGPATTDTLAEKEDSTETRSVGGRRFRRQGSAWVDTAYNSSRPTTNVARGSEQYRALVADEPPLRTIAEQLRGEVIVVWKSRAYRFY